MSANFTHPIEIRSLHEARDTGNPVLRQTAVITQNSTNAVSQTFTLPANAQLVGFQVAVQTAFDSASTAVLSIGTSAGNAAYLGALDVKTGGLIPLTATHITAARATAMANIGSNTSVVATVTPTGATTAGIVRVTVLYAVS